MIRNRGLIWDTGRVGWNQKMIGGRGGALNVILFRTAKSAKISLKTGLKNLTYMYVG